MKCSYRTFCALYLSWMFLGLNCLALAEVAPVCKEVDYKVATPKLLALKCEEGNVSNLAGNGVVYDLAQGPNAPLPVNIATLPYPGANKWLILHLTSSNSSTPVSLDLGKKYKFVLSLQRSGQPVPPDLSPTSFEVEMSNSVVMSPAVAVSSSNLYEFVSHFAYKGGPDGLCTLQVEDFNGKTTDLRAKDCIVRAPIDPTKITSAQDLARVASSPEDIGSFQLTLQAGNKGEQQLPVSVPNLIDIFDKPVKIDAKTQLLPEKAPASKDSSNYYVNLNYGAGRGSKPGWVLDGRIAPTIGRLVRGYQFSPIASADVGANQVSNLKYTDTINFGVAFAHMYEPGPVLQGLLFKPGITYETDREFDRHNLLANPDAQFRFAKLYNPRQRASAVKYSKELKIAQAKKIPWTRANSKPVLFGYALDFHLGLELGGALKDTTVKASSGKAALPLPSYNIARVVPQVHGLWEIGRFSIDAVGIPRYISSVENTVLEHPDHTLFLKRVHGWNAFAVITATWTFDPAGHFGLTVAYKNGFSPPKFSRVNTVQSGITIKY
jgi:hypothetical protein